MAKSGRDYSEKRQGVNVRILIVSPVFPLPLDTGTKVRLYNIIRMLLDRGHQVGLVSMIFRDQLGLAGNLDSRLKDLVTVPVRKSSEKPLKPRPPFRELVRRSLKILIGLFSATPLPVAFSYHPRIARALERLEGEYDVILIEFFFMAQNISSTLFRRTGNKLVLVEHDISFIPQRRHYEVAEGFRRCLAWIKYRLYRMSEISTLKKFSHIFAMSDIDRQTLLSLVPGKRISIVPNGVDLDTYNYNPQETQGRHELIFIGGMLHEPNLDGVMYFIREVLPVLRPYFPHMVLTVIGRTNGARSMLLDQPMSDMVQLAGFVPDLNAAFSRAAAMVVPLRVGGGTRLKILEAMAAGVPVVTTEVGAEGLPVKDREHVLFAETPEQFLTAVQSLINETELRERLVRSARTLVEDTYSWEAIVTSMEEALYQGSLKP